MADPKALLVSDVADVEKYFPGELERIRVWFRDYKVRARGESFAVEWPFGG